MALLKLVLKRQRYLTIPKPRLTNVNVFLEKNRKKARRGQKPTRPILVPQESWAELRKEVRQRKKWTHQLEAARARLGKNVVNRLGRGGRRTMLAQFVSVSFNCF